MTRQSIVDGQFYDINTLPQIENCFKNKEFGPGSLPGNDRNKKIFGVICPHAGYTFSGSCQAFSYKEIAESKLPDIYIMFGLSHSGFNSSISLEDWQTPLGTLKTDAPFGKKLSEISNVPVDEIAHQNEHSIEVQLPFLQYINQNKDFKILPIIIGPDIDIKEFAKSVVGLLKKTNKSCIIIASSDFTHFGPNYGYTPFSTDVKENMHKLDKAAIDTILNLNSEEFIDFEKKTKATICGFYPIIALIETVKLLGADKTELLKYYTSGDIINDYANAVGYASIVIR